MQSDTISSSRGYEYADRVVAALVIAVRNIQQEERNETKDIRRRDDIDIISPLCAADAGRSNILNKGHYKQFQMRRHGLAGLASQNRRLFALLFSMK
jgi:hypothetical protein